MEFGPSTNYSEDTVMKMIIERAWGIPVDQQRLMCLPGSSLKSTAHCATQYTAGEHTAVASQAQRMLDKSESVWVSSLRI